MKSASTIVAALLLTLTAMAQKKNTGPKTFDLLIGTYTTGESKGIHVYRFYVETGATAYLSQIEGVDNPSYIAVSANNKFVYSVNEIGTDRKGSASAFAFEPKEGKLTFINKQATSGAGPCFISVDKNQKHVFTANYAGGSLSVFPVAKDGALQPEAQHIQDAGHSVNKSRQAGPHVHQAILSPDEKYLLYTDLGTDKINIYRYKSGQDQPLSPADPASISVNAGHGPRHIDFSPDKKYMYLITEMGGVIYVYDYNKGEPKQLEAISLVADGYKGAIGAADLHVSPDGKFLYATNRGDANEIIVFAVNPQNGRLTFVERKPSMGKGPRNFVIDPTGTWLLVANQNSDSIYVYKIDKATGKLTLSRNKPLQVGNPSCLKFAPAK